MIMARFNGAIASLSGEEKKKAFQGFTDTDQYLIHSHFGKGGLPVEAGRYRLIWAKTCPFAHRSKIIFGLLGLDDVISTGTVFPEKDDKLGWTFALDSDGKDPVLGIRYLVDIYNENDPDYQGRASVPTLVDVKERKVVYNDFYNITYEWEVAWKPFHKEGAPDLYPEALRREIDELNDIIYRDINSGVYQVGNGLTEEARKDAFDRLFARLDQLEERLSHQRYLFGNHLTDADIRLFTTLIRFDVVYNPLFGANRNKIADFPNLSRFTNELYEIPAFRSTTDLDAIVRGYKKSFEKRDQG
jgi:putative glutathione S-transferase